MAVRPREWILTVWPPQAHLFQNVAYLSLVTFDMATHQIRDALMSMAMAPDTFPGVALLNALLAYSSLHRHGLNKEATLPSPNPTYAILSLLSEVCETLVDPRDPRSHHEEYISSLKALERRIDDVSVTSSSFKLSNDASFAVELYQVATRIYLARASQSPWEPPENLDSLIEAGFSGTSKTCASGCEHFFPLLIIACEARRDEQRVAILNLVERTQRDFRIRSVRGVTDAIKSIWVQQDLHADGDILVNYLDVMSAGISSTSTIPSFA
ncbi:hypothetical protein ACHAPT_002198 [Fusarium lateritium]